MFCFSLFLYFSLDGKYKSGMIYFVYLYDWCFISHSKICHLYNGDQNYMYSTRISGRKPITPSKLLADLK